jgi:hypothetical protein
LLLAVYSDLRYAQAISKKLGKEPSPVSRQLKMLASSGYLIASKEQLLNKTLYEINWEKIISSFCTYFLNHIIEIRGGTGTAQSLALEATIEDGKMIGVKNYKSEIKSFATDDLKERALRELIILAFNRTKDYGEETSLGQIWASVLTACKILANRVINDKMSLTKEFLHLIKLFEMTYICYKIPLADDLAFQFERKCTNPKN